MPPAAKTWPDEQVVELASVSAGAVQPDHHQPKRPQPPQQHLHPPADYAFHRRLSIGSLSDTGFGPSLSPVSFASRSPSPAGPAFRPSSPILPAASLHHASSGPGRLPPWLAAFWARNRAVFFVFFAQMFGSLMNLCARLLEVDDRGGGDPPLHPIQLLFVRMSLTTIGSCVYMHRARVPHAPLGPPGLRGLLLLRGLTNFFSIFCMWSAMIYLPLAEATVFSFLTPSATGYLCHLFMHHPFTRREQIASLVALLGVVLIARPTSVVAVLAGDDAVAAAMTATVPESVVATATAAASAVTTAVASAGNSTTGTTPAPADALSAVSATQRLLGVGAGLVGVLGSASAYAAIRAIGTRAHPLVSVTYFSACCTLVTALVLTVTPLLGHHDDAGGAAAATGRPLGFAGCVPASLRQCALMVGVCVLGFCAQFLSTKGMGLERSNRATAMIYTQMLFAAGFDRFIFGHVMDAVSLAGCGLIIGGALWAATARAAPAGLAKAEDDGPETTGGHSRQVNDCDNSDNDGNDGNDQSAPVAWTHADMELGHMPARRHRGLVEERHGGSAHDPAEGVPMLAAHGADDEDDEMSIEHQDTRT